MNSKGSRSAWLLFGVVVLFVLLTDILTKQLVLRGLWTGDYLGGLLRVTLVNNPGAAFGLFPGARPAFIVIKAMALIVILALLWRGSLSGRLVLPLALIFGGALGNLLDRVRERGEVIDFIDIGLGSRRWYVFNVADACISVGAILIMLFLILRPGSGPAEHTSLPAD